MPTLTQQRLVFSLTMPSKPSRSPSSHLHLPLVSTKICPSPSHPRIFRQPKQVSPISLTSSPLLMVLASRNYSVQCQVTVCLKTLNLHRIRHSTRTLRVCLLKCLAQLKRPDSAVNLSPTSPSWATSSQRLLPSSPARDNNLPLLFKHPPRQVLALT